MKSNRRNIKSSLIALLLFSYKIFNKFYKTHFFNDSYPSYKLNAIIK